MGDETIVLSGRQVAECLPPEDVLGLVEDVFAEWGRGQVVMPAKVNLDMSRSGFDSWANAMPAYLVSANAAGLKWVGGYAANPARGLPYIRSLVVLTEPATGQTLAVMDGTYISDWRTGASAAVAAKHLANQPIRRIAMVGAGAQGRTAARCLHQVFGEAEYTVADLSAERRQAFCTELVGMAVQPMETVAEAVAGAEVVVLLTTAKTPFLEAEWLAPGAVVLAMGSYQQATDAALLGADRIIVDSWAQAAHRGELKNLVDAGRLSESDIAGELGAVVAGVEPGRRHRDERIVVVLVGLGAHDVRVAGVVYERARERGLGQRVCLD